MSWFSLGVQTKQVWDSYSCLNGVLYGNICGNAIVDHGLKKCPLYLKHTEKAASLIADSFTPHCAKLSHKITPKILEKAISKDQISGLSLVLKDQCSQLTARNIIYYSWLGLKQGVVYSYRGMNVATQSAYSYFFSKPKDTQTSQDPPSHSVRDLIQYIRDHYSNDEALKLITLLKDREFAEFMQSILISSLTPVCEKAVAGSLSSTIKLAVQKGIDFGAKYSTTRLVQFLFYKTFMATLFQQTASLWLHQNDPFVSQVCYPGEDPTANVAGLLYYYTLYSIAIHALSFGLKISAKPSDKEQIEEMLHSRVKEPLEKKIKENPLFAYLELDQKTIDSFIEVLVKKFVEYCWDELSQKKALGIPVVS